MQTLVIVFLAVIAVASLLPGFAQAQSPVTFEQKDTSLQIRIDGPASSPLRRADISGRARPGPFREMLGLPYGQISVDNLEGQRLRVGSSHDRPGVAHTDIASQQHLPNCLGQVEQSQQVGDMAAGFADQLADNFLAMAVTVHQLAEGSSFFDRVQVLALDVLNQRDLST
jgi:hypothetical protein